MFMLSVRVALDSAQSTSKTAKEDCNASVTKMMIGVRKSQRGERGGGLFSIGVDWNMDPSVLQESGWPQVVGVTIICTDGPTHTSGDDSSRIGFYLVSESIATAVVSCRAVSEPSVSKHDLVCSSSMAFTTLQGQEVGEAAALARQTTFRTSSSCAVLGWVRPVCARHHLSR